MMKIKIKYLLFNLSVLHHCAVAGQNPYLLYGGQNCLCVSWGIVWLELLRLVHSTPHSCPTNKHASTFEICLLAFWLFLSVERKEEDDCRTLSQGRSKESFLLRGLCCVLSSAHSLTQTQRTFYRAATVLILGE